MSGMVWMPKADLGLQAVRDLRNELTIVPRKARGYGDDSPPAPIPCWVETDDELGVPRAYFFKSARGSHDITWDVTDGHPIEVRSILKQDGPYAEQAVAIQVLLEHFGKFDGHQGGGVSLGGLLKAVTGFGKTNTAIELIARMKRTTLIITHKEFLAKQWVERIRWALPGAKVGMVQGPKCEFEGNDIAVAMIQSLSLEDPKLFNRYPEEFYRWPGLIVLDEVHRVGAATWAPVPNLFPARYRLGLTATPRRKDGADKVFWWNIGDIVYTATTETPVLDVRKVRVDEPGPAPLFRQETPSTTVMTILTKQTNRNHKVIGEMMKALKSKQGRKLLVLSERLEHLRDLELMLRDELLKHDIEGITTDFYVGDWFTGESTLCLKRAKVPLSEADRKQAIATIYAKFRRVKFGAWEFDERVREVEMVTGRLEATQRALLGQSLISTQPCAMKIDGKHYIALYAHGYRPICLEDTSDKGIIALAKDYGIAQDKSKPKMKTRTEEELREAERARVIFATYQMCSEGVDIAAVDTVVFATPVADSEQAYGRGRRECFPDPERKKCERMCPWRAATCEGKPKPIAVDVVDIRVPLAQKRWRWREEFYRSVKAKVVDC